MKVLVACEESQEVCKASAHWAMRRIPATFRSHPADTLSGISWAMRSRPLRGASDYNGRTVA